MKIAYLSKATLPSRQANSIHVMKMCAAFANNGHEIILFAPYLKSNSRTHADIFNYYGVNQNFKIRSPFYPNIKYGEYVYALILFLKVLRFNPELVYSRFPLGSYFTSILKNFQILETHYPFNLKSRIEKPLFEWFIKKKNFIKLIVITEALKKIISSQYPNLTDNIYVAPDGADIHVNCPEKTGITDNTFQVGYVGHLYRGRGIELIIDLAQKCTWAKFHIAGGYENDIERVRKEIERKSINNIILHGFLPPKETNRLRLEMDALIAPYQETVHLAKGDLTTEKWMSPLKIFEYMAAGKAIVCSDLPVLHEVLRHNYNCLFCHPSKIDEWENALIKLRESASLKNKLGENSIKDLTEKYLWTVRAKNLISILQNHNEHIIRKAYNT